MGQIASFMDTLHLTYDEVLNKIPYRNLTIMQKDKLRICYGQKLIEVTDEEMFGAFRKRKKAKAKTKKDKENNKQ